MKIIISLTLGSLLVILALNLTGLEEIVSGSEMTLCSVEFDGSGTHPTLGTAANDINCAVIDVGRGVFTETVNIDHSVTIQGQGSADTRVDGNEVGNVFTINPGSTVIIRDLMVTGGKAVQGGGIYNDQSTLIISGSAIISNTANSGGGIYSNGILSITNSLLSGNEAEEGGGAINTWSAVTPVDTPTLFLDKVIVERNTARYGAGINGGCNSILINESTISWNVSANDHSGSGIVQGCTQGKLRIVQSTINNNHAGGGAGVSHSGEKLEIINSTISGNTANADAAAIYYSGSNSALLSNTTVVGNSGASGGSLRGWFTFANTIIAGNGPYNCEGTFITQGHNLSSDFTCNLFLLSDLQGTNPLIGPLQDNGGSTFTHDLLEESPAIDAGNNDKCPIIDQRNELRPKDGNGDGDAICDIGAYEVDEFIVDLASTNNGPTMLGQATIFSATVAAGSNMTFVWAFGDGTVGNGQNVIHTYSNAKVYTAVVTATNSVSQLTTSTPIIVEEAIAGLTAVSDSPSKIGQTTTFSATVTAGSSIKFFWDFGDAYTSTQPIATHIYSIEGEYLATVTATNLVSSEKKELNIYVSKYKSYLPLITNFR